MSRNAKTNAFARAMAWPLWRPRSAFSRDVELGQVTIMGTDWRSSPTGRNASTEAVLKAYADMTVHEVFAYLQASRHGLTEDEVAVRQQRCGANLLSSKKAPTWWQLLLSVLPNPFNVLLTVLAVISVSTPPPNWPTFTILIVMIVISCAVRFWQEYRSNVAAVKLQASVTSKVRVERQLSGRGAKQSAGLTVDEQGLVPGDVIHVDAGDCIPADCLLFEASHVQISQSSFTGESEPVRKTGQSLPVKADADLFDLENVLLMGTNVISGSGRAVVVRTGDDAFIATIMDQLNRRRPVNAFQRGVRTVSYMMIAFMLVMVPIVLVISGKVTGDWSAAALFAVSVAVGLVPEMLPAIVNANLARGAFELSKRKAIVKRLDAIQNMGGMSVLCSDKTGTLTEDDIFLRHHLDLAGQSHELVLQLGYLNALHQAGTKNSIDAAILRHVDEGEKLAALPPHQKVAEIPFTFEKRRSSCVIRSDDSQRLLLICKGACEEVLALCSGSRRGDAVEPLGPAERADVLGRVRALGADGYRVILVATRELGPEALERGEAADELDGDLTLRGLLTFLDPPKEDARPSIERLQALGVEVKVLTGDTLGVAMKVCRSLNLAPACGAGAGAGAEVGPGAGPAGELALDDEGAVVAITGPELARLEGTAEYEAALRSGKVFAKLTPSQKGEIVMRLRGMGRCVGFLGDGINDGVALRFADVGISVDTGASVAKDCADVILTEKELGIVVECVTMGRLTHGNTIKYIKMVASSNFGNVFSILIASAWLPFEPMTSLQILVQNLLYDISQIAIPWDRMDAEYLQVPRQWDAKDLFRFIVVFGPLSSTIDMCTFCLGWFYYGIRTSDDAAAVARFHTHWFLEGLLTQTLVVHLLRTARVPVFQSRAARPLVATTVSIIAIGLAIPYIGPFQRALSLVQPATSFLGFLAAELTLYALEVQLLKVIYIRCVGTWL